jgi:hypothetical protein
MKSESNIKTMNQPIYTLGKFLDNLRDQYEWSQKELGKLRTQLIESGWVDGGSLKFPRDVIPADFLKDFKENKAGD